ncbi:MAG: response regulator [Candidatus Omnitrophica bacterium]|nr:response regulator [Candidatus Omnitrophota bacterium]
MKKKRAILIVSDESGTRTALRKRLAAEGFQVLEAGGGPDAINLAKRQKPDLVILDLVMTGQGGIESYHAFRRDPELKGIPILFLTALTPSNTVAVKNLKLLASTKRGLEMEESGMIITKPYRPQNLLEEIRKIFGDGKG